MRCSFIGGLPIALFIRAFVMCVLLWATPSRDPTELTIRPRTAQEIFGEYFADLGAISGQRWLLDLLGRRSALLYFCVGAKFLYRWKLRGATVLQVSVG